MRRTYLAAIVKNIDFFEDNFQKLIIESQFRQSSLAMLDRMATKY